ncbi:M1 family metallopeptidase [Kibdelosporangium aridum]|uniref:M1 family metallopeptidase n=1 Tax=Kibdelosporangium aridum TaxID=2030 RepID=UPI0035E4A88B
MTRAVYVGASVLLASLLFGLPVNATAVPSEASPTDEGINVTHYDVNLRYQPEPELLSGVTTILATATRTVSQFDLHLLLGVSSVSVNNEPAAFTAKDGKLTVTPKPPVAAGADLLVVVRYRDNPAKHPPHPEHGWGWRHSPTGAVAVASSAWWYPSSFNPADRATFDVSVTVPRGTEAMASGALQYGGPIAVPGGDQWSWRGTRPQVAQSALLAIGQYDLRTSSSPTGQPVVTAYSTDLGDLNAPARASVDRTPEIVQALSNWFGPYPYNAQGGVVDSAFFNVVATATRPIYAGSYFQGGANASMVAHENAHQWYGNAVNPISLTTRWMSEGFATYAEFLWSEHEGLGTAAELAQYYYDQFPTGHPDWQHPPANPDPNSNSAFPVYTRAALALHALRTAVGDDTFFRIMRTWASAQQIDGVPTTADFIAHAQQISGADLDALFQAWLFAGERPATGPNGPATAKPEPKSYQQITANSRLLTQKAHDHLAALQTVPAE